MGKKWWYRWSLQTQVLLAVFCFTHHALAASKTEATKKGKLATVTKSHKSVVVKSPPARSRTKTDKAVKQPRTTVSKKPFPSTPKTPRVSPSVKSRKTADLTKRDRSGVKKAKEQRAARTKARSQFAQSQRADRRQSRRASAHASRQERKEQSARLRSPKGIRVLALKETKGRKYVKTLVKIPDRTRRLTSTRPTRTSSSFKSRQKNFPRLAPIIPTPDLFTSPLPPAVTEAAQQQTIIEPPPPPSLPKSESPTVAAPAPMSILPPTEQLPSISSPPSSLIVPATPPRESDTSSETAPAILKKPETVEETKLDGPTSWARYTSGRAAFHVKFNGERLLYRLNSVFVLPGDEIFIEVVDPHRRNDYTFRAALEKERQLGPTRWYWNAPSSPGVYPVKIQRTRSHAAITLNVFVMIPLDRVEDGVLNGYRIGHYPTVALRQQPIYTPPRGLVEVTRENEHMLVSPHFRLGQFLCKQESDYPKYMALDARLLTALELLLEKANAQGYHARTFTVMSGYRTPHYNRAIGNSTRYSRHLWGDAADIFIDENPQDGRMDDLNQDGIVDSHDAEVLYDLVESGYASRFQKLLVGGLARYRETSSHGPFVHVDMRGVATRWGAKNVTRGTAATPLPVALRGSSPSLLPQPSYWQGESEIEDAP